MLDKIDTKLTYIILSILGLVIVAFTGVVIYHAKTAADNAYTAARNITVVAPPAQVVHNFYDCEDVYLKTHGESQLTCDYRGMHYTIPSSYTNDMIRGYASVPDSIKPVIVAHAQKIFNCSPGIGSQSVRYFSELKVSKISDKYYDFAEACDSGDHFVYIRTADEKWVMIGPSQMRVSCQDLEKYKLPKDLFGPGPANQVCTDAQTNQKRQLVYKS